MNISLLLKTSRPRFWVYLIGPILVALAAGYVVPTAAVYVLIAYATLPANLLIYGVNDIFDQETDRLNQKKRSYETLLNPKSTAMLSFSIVALNLPFLIALTVLLPHASLPWLGLFLVTGIGYSAPPLRTKARPFLDAATNILYAALGFTAYVALSHHQPPLILVLASALWCMAMHAYSAVPDIAADTAAHTSTIATTLGARPTIIFCGLCYALAGILSYAYIGLFGLAAAGVYLFLMLKSYEVALKPALFTWYARFPVVNTVLGMLLFFDVIVRHSR